MTFSDRPFDFLASLFECAVDAALPQNRMRQFLPDKPEGKVIVIGAGKGSAQMARVFEELWEEVHGDKVNGLVVTRYGYGCECQNVEIVEAAHPVPDQAGLEAAERMLAMVSGLSDKDLVVAVISGGGSALLPLPGNGLSLDEEIAVNETLLASGAPISAMNTVRKHVSRIKGGRLAAAAFPAKVFSLLVSDIPGDHPHYIASGPTVPDRGTREDALAIVRQFGMKLPAGVLSYMESDDATAPMPDDPVFARSEHHVIASAAISLDAAAEFACSQGIDAHILSDSIEGEAREAARTQAAIVREMLNRDRPFSKPALLLSGGETTITLRGTGRGGRNTEFLLALLIELAGEQGFAALCADTDGIDGSQDNAGAFADTNTIPSILAAGGNPLELLHNNDAWTAFDKAGTLFIPGPTGTNVNDFRAILVTGRDRLE